MTIREDAGNREEELALALSRVESEIATYKPELIVVSKTYPISDVEILYNLGVRNFGENRNEEGLEKSGQISARWHYQGEIQSKKLRSIASWAQVIHSLDSLDHASKLNRILEENGSKVELFLQLSLDGDPQRGGASESEVIALAEAVSGMGQITLLGIMCVPPADAPALRAFSEIALFHKRFLSLFPQSPYLSAGMSGDYLVALEHGATHIRVGSKILGQRQYDQ
jgi:pyridoxal phosphate enzyme (YggS family)